MPTKQNRRTNPVTLRVERSIPRLGERSELRPAPGHWSASVSFTAKHHGRCHHCHRPIRPGDSIIKTVDGYRHDELTPRCVRQPKVSSA
jgi:hypothetical protein